MGNFQEFMQGFREGYSRVDEQEKAKLQAQLDQRAADQKLQIELLKAGVKDPAVFEQLRTQVPQVATPEQGLASGLGALLGLGKKLPGVGGALEGVSGALTDYGQGYQTDQMRQRKSEFATLGAAFEQAQQDEAQRELVNAVTETGLKRLLEPLSAEEQLAVQKGLIKDPRADVQDRLLRFISGQPIGTVGSGTDPATDVVADPEQAKEIQEGLLKKLTGAPTSLDKQKAQDIADARQERIELAQSVQKWREEVEQDRRKREDDEFKKARRTEARQFSAALTHILKLGSSERQRNVGPFKENLRNLMTVNNILGRRTPAFRLETGIDKPGLFTGNVVVDNTTAEGIIHLLDITDPSASPEIAQTELLDAVQTQQITPEQFVTVASDTVLFPGTSKAVAEAALAEAGLPVPSATVEAAAEPKSGFGQAAPAQAAQDIQTDVERRIDELLPLGLSDEQIKDTLRKEGLLP